MISYREELIRSWVGLESSATDVANLLGLSKPVTLQAIVQKLREVEKVTLSLPINTSDGAAIRGHVAMELSSDGNYRFSGHMNATGAASYHFGVQAWVGGGEGALVAALKTGRVFGSINLGPKERSWDEPGFNLAIKANWRGFRGAPVLHYKMHAELTGWTGVALDVLKFAITGIAASAALGPAGWYLTIGHELTGAKADLESPDQLAGVLVGAGVLLIVGPFGLVPAVIAGGATIALINIKHDVLKEDQKNFARRVFRDTIRYDDIIVTDMLGTDGNKFCIPYIGNRMLMGLGPAFNSPTTYADPTIDDYKVPGSVFIHELTHAWQITHNSLWHLICKAGSNYKYDSNTGWADQSWASFENEQQAHLVESWFSRYNANLDSIEAIRDARFRFIGDHIRLGVN